MHRPKLSFFLIFFSFAVILITGFLFYKTFAPVFPFAVTPATASANISTEKTAKPLVVIDAGHGGADPGKIGYRNTLEKEINLQIALYLKELLESQDISVLMTREDDRDLSSDASHFKLSDMKNRIRLITESQADLVISIHQNSYTDPKVYGAQCFYYTGSKQSLLLASLLQEQIIISTRQTKIREIKENSDYYLLKHSPVPTVIAECGFLSNPEEEVLLQNSAYQHKMAWALHLGILQFLNVHKELSY